MQHIDENKHLALEEDALNNSGLINEGAATLSASKKDA
jgi:hypothetical protein